MDDDSTHQSADDALEPADDIFNPDVDEERLEGDYDSPAAPANDVSGPSIPADDPRTDSDIDADELYSEGFGEATSASEEEMGLDNRPTPLEPDA